MASDLEGRQYDVQKHREINVSDEILAFRDKKIDMLRGQAEKLRIGDGQ